MQCNAIESKAKALCVSTKGWDFFDGEKACHDFCKEWKSKQKKQKAGQKTKNTLTDLNQKRKDRRSSRTSSL
jgi:hypothetical protein